MQGFDEFCSKNACILISEGEITKKFPSINEPADSPDRDTKVFRSIAAYCHSLVSQYFKQILSFSWFHSKKIYDLKAVSVVCSFIANNADIDRNIRSDFLLCQASYFREALENPKLKDSALTMAINSELEIQKADFTQENDKLESKFFLVEYYLFNSSIKDEYFQAGLDLLKQLQTSVTELYRPDWGGLVVKINANKGFTPEQRLVLEEFDFFSATEDDDLSEFEDDDRVPLSGGMKVS